MIVELLHSLGVLLLLGVTLLPLSHSPRWWIRTLDFPRLQFFVFAVLLIAVQLGFCDYVTWLHYALLLVTLAAAAYQFSWIYPYTPLAPLEAKWCVEKGRKETISILCANVLTPNRKAQALIDIVTTSQPDLLITLESDLWWQDHLVPLEKDYPHCVKWPLDNLFGMHLYSRLPLNEAEAKYLVEDGIPSIHCKVQLPSGRQVNCHFLHPTPPVPEYSTESTPRDAELIVVAKSVQNKAEPIIVAGDLNDVAWSTTTRLFRKISGLLDPRIGRGLFNTFHAEYPLMRWPLDHLFHSRHFRIARITRLASIGSDHFPIVFELAVDPAKWKGQPSADPDSGDIEEAKKTIRAGEESDRRPIGHDWEK